MYGWMGSGTKETTTYMHMGNSHTKRMVLYVLNKYIILLAIKSMGNYKLKRFCCSLNEKQSSNYYVNFLLLL